MPSALKCNLTKEPSSPIRYTLHEHGSELRRWAIWEVRPGETAKVNSTLKVHGEDSLGITTTSSSDYTLVCFVVPPL